MNILKRSLNHCLLITGAALFIAGCSGGSGSSTESNPNTGGGGSSPASYTGPAPQSADVQSFKINLWDNLVTDNRCGACHNTGGQAPTFVRSDDVNLAYNAANTIVDLTNPGNSEMVSKVAGGHNCWLTSDQACADIITGYITAWANDTVGGTVNTITLTAPVIQDVGTSKTFPADTTDFAATVYPVLTTYCAGCHTDESLTPQQPYFAASDVATAYDAAKSKIDLDTPANSRFVLRLRNEFHNCWGDCASNANEMETAITNFSNTITPTTVDPALVISKALTLYDGVVASSGGRYENNLIALYEFKTGAGFTAFDTSGVNPAIDLTLSGDVEWIGGWGIRINDGKAQGSTVASRKLYDLITGTGEYSIEAWVAPANVTQEGPARIVSYSGSTTLRNFTLGQTLYNYDHLNRASTTDANGEPAHSTPDADEVLQATLQHVVATYDPVNGRRIYVNGVLSNNSDQVAGGNFDSWDNSFAFVLGNEVSSDRLWQGAFRLVAIHNRALTQEQISQNFDVGVGEKYFLLFSVSDLISVPDSYIVIEVSQFDSYSYLFNAPFFISLDGSAVPNNIPLSGMRIGINGREAVIGQVYTSVDTTLNSTDYQPGLGQSLSDRGTIIALEKGPDSDEFFLTFEQLGNNTNVVLPPVVPTPNPPADLPEQSDIGVRTFDEINISMSQLTGISHVDPTIDITFSGIKQALPSVEAIETFGASHQMAITQLALGYCDALVETNPGFFPAVNLNGSLSVAQRSDVITPMLSGFLGTGLSTQPDPTAELQSLFDQFCGVGSSCTASQTAPAVKGACAAVLGSAATVLQ